METELTQLSAQEGMSTGKQKESRTFPLVLVSGPLPFEIQKQYRSSNLGKSCEIGFGSLGTGASEEDSRDARQAVRSLGLKHRRRSRLKPYIYSAQ